jgi:hypothetical protein
MKAFVKTLFGDAWNVAGVALIAAVGVGLAEVGRADWAVFAMPVVALCVVGVLAVRALGPLRFGLLRNARMAIGGIGRR